MIENEKRMLTGHAEINGDGFRGWHDFSDHRLRVERPIEDVSRLRLRGIFQFQNSRGQSPSKRALSSHRSIGDGQVTGLGVCELPDTNLSDRRT